MGSLGRDVPYYRVRQRRRRRHRNRRHHAVFERLPCEIVDRTRYDLQTG